MAETKILEDRYYAKPVKNMDEKVFEEVENQSMIETEFKPTLLGRALPEDYVDADIEELLYQAGKEEKKEEETESVFEEIVDSDERRVRKMSSESGQERSSEDSDL